MKPQDVWKILTIKIPNWVRNLAVILLVLAIIVLAVVLIVRFASVNFLTRFWSLHRLIS